MLIHGVPYMTLANYSHTPITGLRQRVKIDNRTLVLCFVSCLVIRVFCLVYYDVWTTNHGSFGNRTSGYRRYDCVAISVNDVIKWVSYIYISIYVSVVNKLVSVATIDKLSF